MAVGTTAFPTSLDTAVELVEIKNNASSTLSGAVLIGDVTIGVTDIAEFPTTGFGTLTDDLTTPTKTEIISWTGISGSNLTGCTRGTQSTSAAAFSSGNFIEVRPTAGHHEALRGAVIAIETKLGSGSAIAVNKLAALTASRLMVTDASGFASAASVTATEAGYLSGVTSAIQTQLNAKGAGDALVANPLSQFAATTSLQLLGVISDETGSGALVFGTSPVLTTPDINGGTADSLTSLSVRSTGAAFDLLFANTEVLTGNKTLTFTVNDTNRTVDLAGNLTLAAAFSTSGANALTLTTTGATNVTLPTTGTLVNSAVTSLSSLTTVGTITSGGLGTGAVLGGVTITLGSDADGDIYYRSSNVLTRLAKGTALQQLRMNAGATAPEWAAAAGGGSPGGTGTEIQYRGGASTFSALAYTSVTSNRPAFHDSGSFGVYSSTIGSLQAFAGGGTYPIHVKGAGRGIWLETGGNGTSDYPLIIASGASASAVGTAILAVDGLGKVGIGSGIGTSPVAQVHAKSSAAGTVGLRVDSAATPSVDIFQTTVNGVAGTGFVVTSTGAPSAPFGTNSERFGAGATGSGNTNVVIGATATSNDRNSNVVIGYGASAAAAGAGSSVAIGYQADAYQGVAIGYQASARGASSIAIGIGATTSATTHDASIVFGRNSIATSTNQMVAGSSSYPTNNIHFGKGVTNATPTAYTINGTGGSGSNIAGAALNLAGGKGTGTGTGGDVNIQFARAGSTGSSLNTLSTIMAFSATATGTTETMTGPNGGTNVTGVLMESITLSTSGTTTDSTIDLPANSIILSVTGRITTTITTATDWKLGDATIADRFSDANATLTSGTTTVGINQWKADRTTAGQGAFQQSTAKVRVTTSGTPGAGVVRITIHYITLSAPTS